MTTAIPAPDASGQTTLTLPDGRRIDVRVSGPADGTALVFHHGTPGAAVAAGAMRRAAAARNLRLITMSRPGYGGSDPHPGRRVVDVVADTGAVLAALGIDRCLVAGWSGGGPHALACAARLDAAAAVLVMAGVAPYDATGLDFLAGMGEENIVEFSAALTSEQTLREYLTLEREGLKAVTAEGVLTAMATVLPEVDKGVITDEFGDDLAAAFREAMRVGVEGWLEDDLAFTAPWGFALDEVKVPTLLWQGSEDLMVPFAHGTWLANALPHATAHLLPGEGHVSVVSGKLEEMLDELVAVAG